LFFKINTSNGAIFSQTLKKEEENMARLQRGKKDDYMVSTLNRLPKLYQKEMRKWQR